MNRFKSSIFDFLSPCTKSLLLSILFVILLVVGIIWNPFHAYGWLWIPNIIGLLILDFIIMLFLVQKV